MRPTITTLETCLENADEDPAGYWRRVYDDGVFGLLRNYARLVRDGQPGRDPEIDHPERIQVHADGRLTVAPAAAGDEDPQRRAGRIAPYQAPEMLMANRTDPDDPARIYALAAILHHAITGSPPYPGREPLEMVHRMLSGDRIKDDRFHATVPPGLRGYLSDALSFDPQRRPSSLRSFALGLEAAAGGDRPRAVPLHAVKEARSPQRRRLVAIASVLLLVVGYWVFAGGADRRRDDVLARLDTVLTSRPFPIHGEDPPHHPLAQPTLQELGDDLDGFERDAELQLYLGWAYLRAGELESAQRAFRRVTRLDPDRVAGWISAGISRLEGGDVGGRRDIAHGLSFRDETAEDFRFRGAGHLYLLEFGAAARAFAEATRRAPERFDVWYHHALALHYDGRPEDARVSLERARARRPGELWITWLEAELMLAEGKGEHVARFLNAQRTRLVGAAPVLLRSGSLLSRVGKVDDGKQWQARAARLIHHGDAERGIQVGSDGRVSMGNRGVLFYGPPPL